MFSFTDIVMFLVKIISLPLAIFSVLQCFRTEANICDCIAYLNAFSNKFILCLCVICYSDVYLHFLCCRSVLSIVVRLCKLCADIPGASSDSAECVTALIKTLQVHCFYLCGTFGC
jgi:hypothetical protein